MAARPVANITVTIATLNRPHALARCLEAFCTAYVLPTEIVIVDQSDNDETQHVIERIETDPFCPPIVYVQQRQRGLSASRNAALKHARCPYIAITDDDCVPDRQWIATLNRIFSLEDAPDVITGRVLPLGPEQPGLYAVSTRDVRERAEFTGKLEPWRVGTGGNLAASRAWFDCVGRFDERLGAGTPGGGGEDMDMLYRLLRAGAHIRYEPEALVFHERQTKARRIATRTTYGRGIGAFCSLWLRRRDAYALYLLYRWMMNHIWAFTAAVRRRQWTRVYEEYLMLTGTLRGALYGLFLPSARQAPGP